MVQLIGQFGALVVGIWWLLLVGFGLAIPLLAFSITRNIKGIRRQLERLNDTLERGGSSSPAQSATPTFAPAVAADNRTAAARPGALGI